MAVLFYIITQVQILKAVNFHEFASRAETAKINRRQKIYIFTVQMFLIGFLAGVSQLTKKWLKERLRE